MGSLQHLPLEGNAGEVLLSGLADIYALKVVAVQSGERGYTVFSHEGIFQLQCDDNKPETVAMLQRWDNLQMRGFTGLTPLKATVGGELAFHLDDQIAYLKALVSGRPGDLALMGDALEAAELLAQLHICSQELPVALQPSMSSGQPMEADHGNRKAELDLFAKMATHRLYPTAFDQLFLKAYELTTPQARQSLQILTAIGNGDTLIKASNLVGLLRRSYSGRDLRVADDGSAHLRHLKGAAWGLLALDVATFLANVGYYSGWSQGAGQRVLTTYTKIRPLEYGEFQLMYGLGIFPNGIWDVAYEYYKGNRQQDDLQATEALRRGLARDMAAGDFWRWLLGADLGL